LLAAYVLSLSSNGSDPLTAATAADAANQGSARHGGAH
jgi:hypothetical protein